MIEFDITLSKEDRASYLAAIEKLSNSSGNPKEVLDSLLVMRNLYHTAIGYLAKAYILHQKTSAGKINERSERSIWVFITDGLFDAGLMPLVAIFDTKIGVFRNAAKKAGIVIDIPELNREEQLARKRLADHINKNTRHFNKERPECYWDDAILLSFGTQRIISDFCETLSFSEKKRMALMSLYDQVINDIDKVCDAAHIGEFKSQVNQDINNYFSREAEKHSIQL